MLAIGLFGVPLAGFACGCVTLTDRRGDIFAVACIYEAYDYGLSTRYQLLVHSSVVHAYPNYCSLRMPSSRFVYYRSVLLS